MNNKNRLISMLTICAATVLHVENASAHLNAKDNEEKCYGVSKAHNNSCASKGNKHSCATIAKADNDPNEWIIVAKGECKKMKGSLTPKDK
jgi:uncharacterized membrane protein